VCADMIRGNASLQESFAQLQVPSPTEQPAKRSDNKTNGIAKVYAIDALLDLILVVTSTELFDLRKAACDCLKAYLFGHDEVRLHFLRRAIDGHKSGVDESANVLTALLRPQPQQQSASADPYRDWFAAVIMFHLLFDSPTAKALAMSVTEGDEANGEEVVTSIQTITAHLLSCLTRADNDRVAVGYLMLLIGWLFEDLDGVNDFLGEGSNVQGLILAALQMGNGSVVVQGLCVMLLGVVYEFSTKDSAIPRATLQPILTSRLGRDKYVDRLSRLRSHPLMRDFEVLPQNWNPALGQRLPDVFFDATFVDFFRDNYSRLLRAIDREPGLEIAVVANGVQRGISREMVDSLRAQLDEKTRTLQEVQSDLASLERQLGQEQADHRRTKETSSLESAKARSVGDSLQKRHEQELSSLRAEYGHREQEMRRQLEQVRKAGELEFERLQRRAEADMADLKATISRLEVDIMKVIWKLHRRQAKRLVITHY
jgi:intracellular protein transport protein USO1